MEFFIQIKHHYLRNLGFQANRLDTVHEETTYCNCTLTQVQSSLLLVEHYRIILNIKRDWCLLHIFISFWFSDLFSMFVFLNLSDTCTGNIAPTTQHKYGFGFQPFSLIIELLWKKITKLGRSNFFNDPISSHILSWLVVFTVFILLFNLSCILTWHYSIFCFSFIVIFLGLSAICKCNKGYWRIWMRH